MIYACKKIKNKPKFLCCFFLSGFSFISDWMQLFEVDRVPQHVLDANLCVLRKLIEGTKHMVRNQRQTNLVTSVGAAGFDVKVASGGFSWAPALKKK